MVHLAEMYDKFIDDNQRLEVLPAPERDVNPDDNAVAAVAGEVASADVACAHHKAVKRPKKAKRCPVQGCDGSGHKNLRRWARGHTTRAGCPKHHNVAPRV